MKNVLTIDGIEVGDMLYRSVSNPDIWGTITLNIFLDSDMDKSEWYSLFKNPHKTHRLVIDNCIKEVTLNWFDLLDTGKVALQFIEGNQSHRNFNRKTVIEEKSMKTENIASMMIENLKTIAVKFPATERYYTYKTIDDFEIGDFVIVKTQNKLQVVEVVEVHKVPQIDVDSNIKYQWIVQKVDTTSYDEMTLREDKFAEHLLEIQQKAIRANASRMLAEKLGVEESDLLEASKLLKLENNDD